MRGTQRILLALLLVLPATGCVRPQEVPPTPPRGLPPNEDPIYILPIGYPLPE